MNKKVVIIDYQLGNLFSVHQVCLHLGYDAIVSSNPDDLIDADFAILPGVGAFSDAMKSLKKHNLDRAIKGYVDTQKPFMGICLGQQLILTKSEEFEHAYGLGLVEGTVKKIPKQVIDGDTYKVPQIQWNKINKPQNIDWTNSPLAGCKSGDYFYFVHSYYTELENEDSILATTTYGDLSYCSSIKYKNIFTTQFHPEKSGQDGIEIYKNWFNNGTQEHAK